MTKQLASGIFVGLVFIAIGVARADDGRPKKNHGRILEVSTSTINLGEAVDKDQRLAQVVFNRTSPIDVKAERHRAKKSPPIVTATFSIPDLTFPLHEGDVGRLPRRRFEMLQVAGKASARIRVSNRDLEEDWFVEGLDCSHFVDGHVYTECDFYFLAVAPKHYQTVTGATRTVPHIQQFDVSKAELLFRKMLLDEAETARQFLKPIVVAKTAPETRAKAALTNARNLIKAKLYIPAEARLRQIIKDVPGTPTAEAAQKELEALPH